MAGILTLSSHTIGAPSRPILYKEVSYAGKEYVVCYVSSLGREQPFVIDKEKLPLLLGYPSWHVTAENYISTSVTLIGKKKSLYLHNLVMGKLTFDGKGQTTTVDHINRNGFDNRLENLRFITQSEQNINQSKKPRTVILPEDAGIDPETIPRHIWYVRASGGHGDRFAIEFKSEGIVWKTTSSKAVPLVEKLEQAKQKLQEYYVEYPHLNPNNPAIVAIQNSLNTSYQAILDLAETT